MEGPILIIVAVVVITLNLAIAVTCSDSKSATKSTVVEIAEMLEPVEQRPSDPQPGSHPPRTVCVVNAY
ncbi:MAG: hypothetical protein RQ731_03545 [Anaerosomatales bacterium]|nr:hypothetical protein [Anaerosomatales bacterium]MDT8433817.1 hypothetical protein [Anaerosomatales bacterium]